jgi:hypothetical protein
MFYKAIFKAKPESKLTGVQIKTLTSDNRSSIFPVRFRGAATERVARDR